MFLEQQPKKQNAKRTAKAIYKIKIFLFREEYKWTKQKRNDLRYIYAFL